MTKNHNPNGGCNGINKRRNNKCLSHQYMICEDCGKSFCYHHSGREDHNCDDSVKGCHSIWKKGGDNK